MWLAPTACSVRLEYQRLNPSRAYTWAQFLAEADGLNATGGPASLGIGFLSQTSW